jgi:hypothetical protein
MMRRGPVQIAGGLLRSMRGTPLARPRNEPPETPAGMQPAPPDFVGVGTARSGTTWWDALIHAHRDVIRVDGVPKEVHYFDRFADASFGPADADRYHAFFPRPPGKLAGEWTPGYMLHYWTPAQLRAAAPDARLLVLLRDPVERFRSGLTLTENRMTFSWNARGAANGGYQRGIYADQLLRLWRVFPREQVLILQYERCVRDPVGQLRRTFEFVGLDPEPAAGLAVQRRVNETRGDKVPLTGEQTRTLVERYAPENERLSSLVPELDLDLWRRP